MFIKINGKKEEVKPKTNLNELVASMKLCAEKIVIEHNFRIVSKEKWEQVLLKESDNIEIVSFVGGG